VWDVPPARSSLRRRRGDGAMTACPNPFRQALDPSASAPARMNGDPLARAAALVRSLRPEWRDAETFYAHRSEAIAAIRAAATADRCDRCEAHARRERVRPLEVLLRHAGAEAARYRRLLASAVRPPRRRPAAPDPRQAVLPLA